MKNTHESSKFSPALQTLGACTVQQMTWPEESPGSGSWSPGAAGSGSPQPATDQARQEIWQILNLMPNADKVTTC